MDGVYYNLIINKCVMKSLASVKTEKNGRVGGRRESKSEFYYQTPGGLAKRLSGYCLDESCRWRQDILRYGVPSRSAL